MKEEVKRWMRIAKDDLKSAQANFDNKQYYVCVFLSQQSVEKALKAAVIKKTSQLIKIHDLVILGKKVNLPEGLLQKCDELNNVYLDTRYGDIGGKLPSQKFKKSNSVRFLHIAKEVVKWLEKRN